MDKRLLSRRLREILVEADGLILSAGAGMGVESGLPDFRGTRGFWEAYPALGKTGTRFEEIANPRAFRQDPRLAWGFYAHRLNLYRRTCPHRGFGLLRVLAARYPLGSFVYTSNVDGQFQAAGFPGDRIVECHGSIHFLQCLEDCRGVLWSAEEFHPEVDSASGRLLSPLPLCPHCGALVRPGILMFGDGGWNDGRTREQEERFLLWRRRVIRPAVVEIGAGTAVPTVRFFGESQGSPLIRINPREAEVSGPDDLSLACGAVEGIDLLLRSLGEGAGSSGTTGTH